jgi:hypothetical protein
VNREPVPQKKARGGNRVSVSGRNGIVTLRRNGEVFSITLEDTARLAELFRECEQLDEDDLAQKLRLIIDKVNSQPRSASFAESWSALRLQIRRDTLQATDGTLSPQESGLLSAITDYMVTKLARRRRLIRPACPNQKIVCPSPKRPFC